MKKSAIIVAIVFMMIGFAAVSTSLIINSNIKVSENETDFDVYFSKARLDTIDVYESVISQDKKTITFNTNNLSKVGDKSVLTYEVTNNSNNYDAEVRVTCTPENNKYTSITNTIDVENDIVPARNTAKGRVTITLNKTSLEEVSEEYTCSLEFNAVERESIGISSNKPAEPELTNDLVPVIIADNGTVKKADTTTEWYNYENKVWANAVILKDDYDDLNENGKINGATKEDNQVTLDGVDDYINLGLENYDFKDSMTLAIKLRFNKDDSVQEFFGNWEVGGMGIGYGGYNNKKLVAAMYDKSSSSYVSFFSNQTIKKNKEYLIAISYDGKNLKLYIDGKLDKSVATTGNIGLSSQPIFIGANPSPSGTHVNYSNISVKKAAIYDRALSEEEITKYYKNDIIINDDTDLLKYVNFEKTTANDEIIPENNIESYFVWIPRYKYKLFNVDNYSLTTVASASEVESKAQEIEIEFESRYDKVSNGSKNGEWLTHPAFTSFDTNGFWVGKFETGYKGATTTTAAQVNESDFTKVIIKPNVYSWRNITVKNIFETSYNYNRDADSHMIKNTEWGAVAYLSHSKYGIDKEININNNSSYKTGYSSLPTLDQSSYPGTYGDGENYNQPYNTSIGYLASTTRNISGVYDMSGGAWEYTAGYMSGQLGNSEITPTSYDSKYIDVYSSSSTIISFNYRILGDATGEMGPFNNYLEKNGTSYYHGSWYNEEAHFINSSFPWFFRGGYWDRGVLAGIFYFDRFTGGVHVNVSFRLVLTP